MIKVWVGGHATRVPPVSLAPAPVPEAALDHLPLSAPLDVAAIVREHGPYAYRLLRRLGIPAPDLDDAFQEVFLVVYRKLDTFEGRSALGGWVYGICVRVASHYRRKRRTSREIVSADTPEVIDPTTPAENLDTQEARKILSEFLDHLDEDKRTVFVLYELEGLTMQEIAQLLNCPVQTAYSRLRLAREDVANAVRRYRLRKNLP